MKLCQITSITNNDKKGKMKYSNLIRLKFLLLSFINNFIPSKTGWKRPAINTLLGPTRICIYPKILRSKRVKNATHNKTITYKIKNNKNIIFKFF